MTTPVLDLDGRVADRRDEFDELRGAVETAERVGGGCVLLSGVPGVGKTTLMQAFGTEISQRDCVFAYGRYQDGARAPYSALGDAFGALVRTMETTSPAERDRWRADLASGTTALSSILSDLVPDLARLVNAEPQPTDLEASDARRRLQRATIRLIAATAKLGRVASEAGTPAITSSLFAGRGAGPSAGPSGDPRRAAPPATSRWLEAGRGRRPGAAEQPGPENILEVPPAQEWGDRA